MTEPLEAEIHALKKCKDDLAETIQPLMDQKAKLDEEIAALSAPFEKEIAEREENIRNAVLVLEKSYKCDVGKVTYRKGYPRVSWDDKALQGYMSAGHPEIEQFRKETFVKPSVTIVVD